MNGPSAPPRPERGPGGRLHLPRTRRGWVIAVVVVAVLALGGGVAVVELVVFGTSSPPPLTLSTVPRSTSMSTSTSATSSAAGNPGLQGSWTVATGSVAGYRVREQLGSLPAPSDAVGRTSSITGTAALDGLPSSLVVTSATLTVDVSTLTSDRSMRDRRIHSIGLESDRFPTATFTLSAPLPLPATASTGADVHVSAVGNLTIHGSSRSETIPLDARLSGSDIEVAGSITFGWSDFGMEAPSIGGFVSVGDRATMEFDVHLRRG